MIFYGRPSSVKKSENVFAWMKEDSEKVSPERDLHGEQ